jgi:uncharacterized protein (TIGR02145 family)
MRKTAIIVAALAAIIAITSLMVPILIGMDNTFAVDVPAETAIFGTFSDKRDGKVYKIVKIGRQFWFAENLNYEADGSVCYENSADNCAKYGRLYNWETALTACPDETHLPTNDEWVILINYTDSSKFAGGSKIVGWLLKSTKGWNRDGNGVDEYGFSALPGGLGYDDGSFINAGLRGIWWSATENDANYARGRDVSYNDDYLYGHGDRKTILMSVRCVQDD